MAQQRDPYTGRSESTDGVARRDQEGPPQAGPSVPPRPQPGRQEGRGALQGDLSRPTTCWSDPDKRKAYDRGGFGPPAAVQRRRLRRLRHGGFADILSEPVRRERGGGRRRRRQGRGRGPRPEAGRDLEVEDADLVSPQSIEGSQVPIVVPTTERCGTCNGTGAKPGTSPKVCPRCQGRGVESQGQGAVLHLPALPALPRLAARSSRTPAPPATARARLRTTKRYRANIPAGVKEGSKVRLAGKGEPGTNGGPPGDLFVVVHVESSPIFSRKGDNVEVEVPLTVPEALQGAEDRGPDPQRGARPCASPAARSTAPCSASAARARRSSAARTAATSTTASSSTSLRRCRASSRRRCGELSKVMNGNPRSSTLREREGRCVTWPRVAPAPPRASRSRPTAGSS